MEVTIAMEKKKSINSEFPGQPESIGQLSCKSPSDTLILMITVIIALQNKK